ncbi:2-oxo acid dehydrogenase subunit E2 [bacterium]|nr:2-oxo acid dehydrogenase subunit E2 [bacterium]
MATEIKMPQLSDTMDSGKILSWSKQEGETVTRGDILAEVETDKANLEIESFHKGVLLKIVTNAGDSAGVGEVIAYIGDEGEEVAENGASSSSAESSSAAPSEPTPEPTPEASAQEDAANTASSPTPPAASYSSSNGNGHQPTSQGRIKASPLAKKIASERGIDLSSLSGSGPEGRIVRRDIESAAAASAQTSSPQRSSQQSQAAPVASETAAKETPRQSETPSSEGGKKTPFSKMRSTIARRMQQSVNEAPHFYVTTSVCMDNVMTLRKTLKEKKGYEKTSINHFVIKAAAYGIAAEPRVNNAVRDEEYLYEPEGINIGIITAIEDGLLIPVVKQADKLSLKDLVFEARSAVERARAGRPNAQDLVGGTFSISNMGMFDVESFTAVINPGQGSVLAVSSILEQPVARDGELVVANMMKVTISVDHRIIDGVMAGNFLKAFKEALENPALLLL